MLKILFILFLFNFGISIKSSGQTRNIDSLIIEAAMDSLYYDYRIAVLAHQNNIVMGVYDLPKIGEWLRGHFGYQMCQDSLGSFYEIKGGKEYQEAHCQQLSIFNKLKLKYPEIFGKAGYSASPMYSNGSIPAENNSTKVLDYFNGHSKRFQIEREKSLELFYQRANGVYPKD